MAEKWKVLPADLFDEFQEFLRQRSFSLNSEKTVLPALKTTTTESSYSDPETLRFQGNVWKSFENYIASNEYSRHVP